MHVLGAGLLPSPAAVHEVCGCNYQSSPAQLTVTFVGDGHSGVYT
jgi:hypothetical protein